MFAIFGVEMYPSSAKPNIRPHIRFGFGSATFNGVRMLAIRIQEMKHMSYIDRLKNLNLPTLLYRRLRGDMNMVYKLLSGLYDSNIVCNLVKPNNYVTRGHHLRLFKKHVHYDLRK